jgi:iron complex outermembrane receptor protein
MGIRDFRCWAFLAILAAAIGVAAPLRAAETTQFDLPAQPLADALRAVGDRTNHNIFFDPKFVNGRSAPALKASLSLEEALNKLLQGTGLTAKFVDKKTIRLVVNTSDARSYAAPQAGAVRLAQGDGPGYGEVTDSKAVEQPAESPADSVSSALQEVVITAQRREENLQKVPLAATAITGDQLASKGVVNLQSLQFLSPSLTVSDSFTSNISIRGIGLATTSPTTQEGVAIYLDGLFVSPISATSTLYDMANVEVLRGPQGTLVGTNSTGGAVFFNTQSPKPNQTEGYAEVSYGNYDTRSVQGAINLPVTDTLTLRFAGNFDARDSFYRSIGPVQTDADMLNEKQGRLGVLWQPGAFQALLKVDFFETDRGGWAYRPVPGTTFAAFAPAQPFDLDYDTATSLVQHGTTVGLELRYKFDNGMTIRSLSGYMNRSFNVYGDGDATAVSTPADPQEGYNVYADDQTISQELNLISPTGERLDWILGAYASYDKYPIYNHNTTAGQGPVDIVFPEFKTTTGWFGQLNYRFLPRLEVQAGLRYSTYKDDGTGGLFYGAGVTGFPAGGILLTDLSGRYHDSAVTGKLAINFTVDDNNLIYAFAARGYKPGGFDSQTLLFQKETVWDYEAGWKSTLAGGHVRTQLGGFYNHYLNFQNGILIPSTGQSAVQNLPGTSVISGAEAQLQTQFGGFQADGGVAYVHSKLGALSLVNTRLLPNGGTNLGPQCPAGAPSNPPLCFNYQPYELNDTGGSNLFSPEWTANIGAQYRFAFANMSLTPRVNFSYVGSQWTSLFYSPVTDYLPSRRMVSANLTLDRQSWQVQAYGTNLTNSVYVSGVIANTEILGPPRQFGLRVRRWF